MSFLLGSWLGWNTCLQRFGIFQLSLLHLAWCSGLIGRIRSLRIAKIDLAYIVVTRLIGIKIPAPWMLNSQSLSTRSMNMPFSTFTRPYKTTNQAWFGQHQIDQPSCYLELSPLSFSAFWIASCSLVLIHAQTPFHGTLIDWPISTLGQVPAMTNSYAEVLPTLAMFPAWVIVNCCGSIIFFSKNRHLSTGSGRRARNNWKHRSDGTTLMEKTTCAEFASNSKAANSPSNSPRFDQNWIHKWGFRHIIVKLFVRFWDEASRYIIGWRANCAA